jgi:peptide/nickel transport system permease protein
MALAQAPTVGWTDDGVVVTPRSYTREVAQRFLRSKAGVVALAIILFMIAVALAGPLLMTHDPLAGNVADRLKPIGTSGHLLGTDEQGRDMLDRIIAGGRLSLLTGILPVFVATVIGTLIGATAGYIGGPLLTIVMRLMDVGYAFPALLLAIAVASSLGPGVSSSIIALSIVFIPPIVRVAESSTRQVIVQEYIEAARLSGAGTLTIVRSQILANIFSPIFVYASSLVGLSIVIASGLSFLGLGARPPTPEWGYMLNSLRETIYVQPWLAALPGLFIFVVAVSFNVLSDALNDALDIKDA